MTPSTIKKKISFILTTLNEVSYVTDTINIILEKINPYEIIIIDDGSTDGTLTSIEQIQDKRVKLFVRESKLGLSSAISMGINKSSGSIICWMDTGMNYLLDKYLEGIELCDTDNKIIVLSRYVPNGSDERVFARKFSSYLINKFCKIILNLKFNDFTSGLFVIPKVLMMKYPFKNSIHGEFTIEHIYRLNKNGVNLIEIPYNHLNINEENSTSFQNLFDFIKLGFFYVLFTLKIKFK